MRLPHSIDQGVELLAGFRGGDGGLGAACCMRTFKRAAPGLLCAAAANLAGTSGRSDWS